MREGSEQNDEQGQMKRYTPIGSEYNSLSLSFSLSHYTVACMHGRHVIARGRSSVLRMNI